MKRVAVVLTGLLVSALQGCAQFQRLQFSKFPANPVPGAQKVLVLPFLDYTRSGADGVMLAEVFATEMTRFPGFAPIRPGMVSRFPTDVSEARAVGREAGADAVIVASISSYSPYYPPRLGVALQWFRVEGGAAACAPDQLDLLIRSGRPLQITGAEEGGYVLAVLEEVFDASNLQTRDDIRVYSQVHGMVQEDYPDEGIYLYSTEKFAEFVSYQVIRRMIRFAQTRQPKEVAGGTEVRSGSRS